jgi:transcriptional regulator with XRE-family HTH domain
MISPEQCRTGRALLRWTLKDLARHSGLTNITINKFEHGIRSPTNETLAAIRDTLEAAGIEFIPDGLRKHGKRLEARFWEGDIVYEKMLNDIFETARDRDCEILLSGINERMFANVDKNKKLMQDQAQRLRKQGLKKRILYKKHDKHFIFPPDISTYRWLSQDIFGMAPSATYGNKIAFIVFEPETSVTVIENAGIANAHRKQFEALWSIAEPVPFSEAEVSAICEKNLLL